MKVIVERGMKHFRLSWTDNRQPYRELIPYRNPDDTWWDRKYSTEALNLLENVYCLVRRNIRFVEG